MKPIPAFISSVNPARGLQSNTARRSIYPYNISPVNPADSVSANYGMARIRPPGGSYASMPKSFQEVTREDRLRRNLVQAQLSSGVVMPMDGCDCGIGGLGDAAPPAEAVQVAKEVLDLFNKQRARVRSKYQSMVNSINAQIKDDLDCVRKYQDSKGYKSMVNSIRATMPNPSDIPAVLSVAGAVLRAAKIDPSLYRAGTNCAVLKIGQPAGKTSIVPGGGALQVYLYAQRAAAPAQRLEKLKRLLNPISDAQMLAEIKAGQFKLFTDSCGHKYVHSNGELSARGLNDVDADWKEMYVQSCPGKSLGDTLKELAVPAAIMIAVPAAINYLATGAVGWAGSGAAASTPAAAAASTPAAAAATAPVAAATPAAAAAISAPAAAAAAAPAAAPLISTLTQAATTAAQVAPSLVPLLTDTGNNVPATVPDDTAQPAAASGGGFLIPALIAGGLLLLTMKG